MDDLVRTGSSLVAPEKKTEFEARLAQVSGWYIAGRRQWSFAHHASLYLSLVFTAAAAVVPQLQDVFRKETSDQANLTTILAAIGALLISLSTSGSFARKWRANRMSYSKAAQLTSELMFRDPTIEDTRRLAEIEDEHNKLIVGE